jgi:hypothetical protein
MTRQKKRPGGGVLIWNFAERGCVRSVSRRAFKMLRLVSDTAALRSNQDTTGRAGASLAQLALRWILEFPAVTLRDSRRETSGAGRGKPCGVGLAEVIRRDDEENPRALRPSDQTAGASLLVNRH